MAIHFSQLIIENFRGIHKLSLDNLNHINILAGANNSGKTSTLEAIQILQNPNDFNSILRCSRMRDSNTTLIAVSLYDNFINLFPRNINPMEISLSGICKNDNFSLILKGERKTVLFNGDESYQDNASTVNEGQEDYYINDSEEELFAGELIYSFEKKQKKNEIKIRSAQKTGDLVIDKKNQYINIIYLSPFDHFCKSTINNIIKDDDLKNKCIEVLKIFDPGIDDIIYLKNELTNRPVEFIKHKDLGSMPLTTYGDGIRKVISLANGVARAADGVLLIDELETSIHSKYYDDVFKFIVKACKQFNVQAFMTTHSIEAIDGMLATQKYITNNEDEDEINIITFKKERDDRKTYSRVLKGRYVHANRKEFGFEVRL